MSGYGLLLVQKNWGRERDQLDKFIVDFYCYRGSVLPSKERQGKSEEISSQSP